MQTSTASSIRPEFRVIDGLRIRVAESADTGKDTEALLLSPWPESIYAYEATWSRLAKHARLTAVDLPGFGRSERRDSLMAPRALGDFIARLADALGLENPHVVAPDIGTSASLFAAALHPGRFRSLVVGSGGAAVPLQLDGVLKTWAEAPDLEPYRKIGGREIVSAVIKTLETYKLSETARADYLAGYEGDRFAESIRYVQAYAAELPVLRDLLPKVRTPVKVINGRHDPVVPLANAQFLVDRLPNSELAVINAGHFIWEDAAAEYANLVTTWWDGGYAASR